MKKHVLILVIGLLLVCAALSAQTTQGAGAAGENVQMDTEAFAGGGYTGAVLEPIAIADLLNVKPNAYVIVSGYLVQQRVPGTFILADDSQNPTISVVVHFTRYGWANLEIDGATPVLVYGIVSRSDLRIEIDADRVEIQK
jgi:uncharacterized protein YdeI (BOF family)